MDTLNTIFVFLTGVFLRLLIPLLATALVVFILHRLDVRWQAEAEKERRMLVKDEMPCWKEQGLPMSKVKERALFSSDQPCWQTHRLSNGYLREACLDCEVFRDAPVPVKHKTHAHTHTIP